MACFFASGCGSVVVDAGGYRWFRLFGLVDCHYLRIVMFYQV